MKESSYFLKNEPIRPTPPSPYPFAKDMAGFEPAKAQLSSSTKTGARQRQLSTSEASYLGSKVVVALYSAL
ncbi:MAG: hypothetical protein ACE5HG_03345 [Candidatus Bathyarchaeia archaeon]